MAVFLGNPGGAPFGEAEPAPSGLIRGPLLTLDELAALAQAPKRSPGTEVSIRATPIEALDGWKDHMFVHYDDGANQLIARGGPTERFGPRFLSRSNRVGAEVTPEASSKDYGAPYRTIATRFLPGVAADAAAAPARAHALGVDRFGNAYDWDSNSNSYAADVAQPILGYRPGDGRTPGYDHRLSDEALAPAPQGSVFTGPLRADNWTPIIRNPPF